MRGANSRVAYELGEQLAKILHERRCSAALSAGGCRPGRGSIEEARLCSACILVRNSLETLLVAWKPRAEVPMLGRMNVSLEDLQPSLFLLHGRDDVRFRQNSYIDQSTEV